MYKWKELIVAHWIKLSLQLSLEISHLTWPTHLSSRGGAKVTASEKWSQERGYIVTFFIWLGNSYMGISARRSNSVRSEQEKQTGRGESEWGGGGYSWKKRKRGMERGFFFQAQLFNLTVKVAQRSQRRQDSGRMERGGWEGERECMWIFCWLHWQEKKNQSLLWQEEQTKAIQMAVCTGGWTDELGVSEGTKE